MLVSVTSDGERADEYRVVEVRGEVDVFTAPELDAVVSDLLAGGVTRLVVDLRAVDFFDSSGLGVLVKALRQLTDQGGVLAVVADDERIRKVFRLTGLDGVIALFDSSGDALVAVLS